MFTARHRVSAVTARHTSPGKPAAGFGYLAVLIAIALLGGASGLAAKAAADQVRRERERQLLEIGHAYRNAIASYWLSTPGGQGHYPASLQDLVLDRRGIKPVSHLRQLYPDPMTGGATWGLLEAPGGGIMGIHSTADGFPFRQDGFGSGDAAFVHQESYEGWSFSWEPGQRAAGRPSG